MPADSRRSAIEKQYARETYEQFTVRFVTSIPRSVETLILRPSSGQRLDDGEMLKVGDALRHLIDDRQHRLTTIYADHFETDMRDQRCKWGAHTDGGWFQKVKSHGKAKGVLVYTQDDPGATESFTTELCERTFE